MINTANYSLSQADRQAIDHLLSTTGNDPSLEQIWQLMDQAWRDCGCDNRRLVHERVSNFYRHPVWLLNGMFIEQHDISLGHRNAITAAVAALAPKHVIDFGGGFGTLARLLASALPKSEILICDPYPPQHGIDSCKTFANIHFVSSLQGQNVDVVVSTDVLEHVVDPLNLLVAMVNSVRLGGHLFIANCFYPVIACHLPSTFHLRHNFDAFCLELGLTVLGPCEGSHATIYRRDKIVLPPWRRLRMMEWKSRLNFAMREWRESFFNPLPYHIRRILCQPLRYPLRTAMKLWQSR